MAQWTISDIASILELIRGYDRVNPGRRAEIRHYFRQLLEDANRPLPVELRGRVKAVLDRAHGQRASAEEHQQDIPGPTVTITDVPSTPPRQPTEKIEEATRPEEQAPRTTQTRRVRRYVVVPPEQSEAAPAAQAPPPPPPQPLPANVEGLQLPLVIRFAVEVFVGTLAFIVLAIPAVGLSLIVDSIQRLGVSSYIVTGLRAVELLIFGTDMLMVAALVVAEALRLGWLLAADVRKAIGPRRGK